MPTVVDLRLRLPAQPRDPHDVPLIFGRALPEPEMAFPFVGDGLSLASRLPWQTSAAPVTTSTRLAWRDAAPRSTGATLMWRDALQLQVGPALPWRQAATVSRSLTIASGAARGVASSGRLPWRDGARIGGRGERDPFRPAPVVPENSNRCGGPLDARAVPLVLWRQTRPGSTRLVFACRLAARRTVPRLRRYIVLDESTLIRVSDGAVVPVEGVTAEIEHTSFAWSFSASLPPAAMPLVRRAVGAPPVELELRANGVAWRWIVESVASDRAWERGGSIRVSGRSLSAELDAPQSPIVTFDNLAFARTSQQLADGAIPLDWTIDWGLDPWLVPAGVWSYQGTAIGAVRRVAEAGGGYVQPALVDRRLIVAPLYPWLPWDSAQVIPDVELPEVAVETESIEWLRRAPYDGVYVTGVAGGRRDLVRRSGTAGDMVAPMIVDALMTDPIATRQRGIPVLADTGPQALVRLGSPLYRAAGLIAPGATVRYVADGLRRLGLVRGCRVTAGDDGITQSIALQVFGE